jgi:TonB family protein
MITPRWPHRQLPGIKETARLLFSLAVSLAAHAFILNIDPELLTWAGPQASVVAQPLSVYLTDVTQQGRLHLAVQQFSQPALIGRSADQGSDRQPTQAGKFPPPSQGNNQAVTSSPSSTFPGPWYYPARYLHRHPSPLKPIWPSYPDSAEHIRGRVIILLLINEEGVVDQYKIRESDPEGTFDETVIVAFTTARYAPALISGYKVKSQLLAEVSFEPGEQPKTDFSILEQRLDTANSLKEKTEEPGNAGLIRPTPSAAGN